MAKKKSPSDHAATERTGTTMIEAAYEAAQRGDVVTARKLSKHVLAMPEHDKATQSAALRLAKVYGQPTTDAADALQKVAHEIQSRSFVFPKSFMFSGIALGVFVFLLVLVRFRT